MSCSTQVEHTGTCSLLHSTINPRNPIIRISLPFLSWIFFSFIRNFFFSFVANVGFRIPCGDLSKWTQAFAFTNFHKCQTLAIDQHRVSYCDHCLAFKKKQIGSPRSSARIPPPLSLGLFSSAQYFGRIRNRAGIEAWAKQMITDCYPDTKDVKMVTNRTRDLRDN